MFHTRCPACLGSDDACEACGGRGLKIWHRCPMKLIAQEHLDLMDSYAAWVDHDNPPVPGGSLAQSRVWARLMKICNVERSLIEEENRPRVKKDAN